MAVQARADATVSGRAWMPMCQETVGGGSPVPLRPAARAPGDRWLSRPRRAARRLPDGHGVRPVQRGVGPHRCQSPRWWDQRRGPPRPVLALPRCSLAPLPQLPSARWSSCSTRVRPPISAGFWSAVWPVRSCSSGSSRSMPAGVPLEPSKNGGGCRAAPRCARWRWPGGRPAPRTAGSSPRR